MAITFQEIKQLSQAEINQLPLQTLRQHKTILLEELFDFSAKHPKDSYNDPQFIIQECMQLQDLIAVYGVRIIKVELISINPLMPFGNLSNRFISTN